MRAQDGLDGTRGEYTDYKAEGRAIRCYEHATAVPVRPFKGSGRALTDEEQCVYPDLLEAVREMNQ